MSPLSSRLPELIELERLIEIGRGRLSAQRVTAVSCERIQLPIYCLTLGSADPSAPAVGFFGGFHGLERIGTQVLLVFIHSLLMRLRWDAVLEQQLARVRLVFMPLVNPGGMLQQVRANPNGVDLMRNAPIDARDPVGFLVGGHRIGAWLPWYRGRADKPMEAENLAVISVVEQELLSRPFSMALDCHSGFGTTDRLWFPLAGSRYPIVHLPEIFGFKTLFDEAYPNHNYLIEPQSRAYLTHGDVWDFLYLKSLSERTRVFLPLTLEMGSWLWVKKNPRQFFSRLGAFNPIAPHRLQRVLRRHFVLLEFMSRIAASSERWQALLEPPAQRRRDALALWYPDVTP